MTTGSGFSDARKGRKGDGIQSYCRKCRKSGDAPAPSSCWDIDLSQDEEEDIWRRLPKVTFGDLSACWIGPLVDSGLGSQWVADMSEAAYGFLEDTGWQEALENAGAAQDGRGRWMPSYLTAVRDAAARLAEGGGNAGPDGSLDHWLGFLVFEMAALHEAARSQIGD